jgi:hypothetical protein
MATVPKTDEEIWRAECAAEDALAAQELTAEQHLRAEAIALFDYGLDRLAVVSILGEDAVKAHEEHWEQQRIKETAYDEEAAIAALDLGEGERADHVAVLGEAAVQAHEALYGTQNNLASPDSLLPPHSRHLLNSHTRLSGLSVLLLLAPLTHVVDAYLAASIFNTRHLSQRTMMMTALTTTAGCRCQDHL